MALYPCLARKPTIVIPIGSYAPAYPPRMPRTDARDELGVGAATKLAVSIGQIRGYKGLSSLAAVADACGDDTRFIIAGAPVDKSEVDQLLSAAALNDRIEVIPEHLDAHDVARLLSAADLFVVPFVSVLHSGSVLLALAFKVPVLVPRTSVFEELRQQVGAPWIRFIDTTLSPDELESALASGAPSTEPEMDWMAWEAIGRQTADFYHKVCTSRMRRRVKFRGSRGLGPR